MARIFTALYRGICADCEEPFAKGTAIKAAGRRQYVHADCAETAPVVQSGRCEDAPCCGCCGPNPYGYATLYTAY